MTNTVTIDVSVESGPLGHRATLHNNGVLVAQTDWFEDRDIAVLYARACMDRADQLGAVKVKEFDDAWPTGRSFKPSSVC